MRTVVTVDLETTGTDIIHDEIVEFAFRIRQRERTRYFTRRVKPNRRIPDEATAVHGISNLAVGRCAPFGAYARRIKRILERADVLIGYNLREFDLPLLQSELDRSGHGFADLSHAAIVDVLALWRKIEPRTLDAAHRRFVGRRLHGAHGARADADATIHVLHSLMREFEIPKRWHNVATQCSTNKIGGYHFCWNQNTPCFAFGKHKGEALCDVAKHHPDYLTWMIEKGDFPSHVDEICQRALKNRPRSLNRWLTSMFGGP